MRLGFWRAPGDFGLRLGKTAGTADCYSKTVKRKRTPAARAIPEPMLPESVIPEKLLEEAKRSIQADRIHKMVLCTVCGSDCAPNSTEGLCWVCRRLKLSAWGDSDSQRPGQE